MRKNQVKKRISRGKMQKQGSHVLAIVVSRTEDRGVSPTPVPGLVFARMCDRMSARASEMRK